MVIDPSLGRSWARRVRRSRLRTSHVFAGDRLPSHSGYKGSKQCRNRLDEGRLAPNCGAFRADCGQLKNELIDAFMVNDRSAIELGTDVVVAAYVHRGVLLGFDPPRGRSW